MPKVATQLMTNVTRDELARVLNKLAMSDDTRIQKVFKGILELGVDEPAKKRSAKPAPARRNVSRKPTRSSSAPRPRIAAKKKVKAGRRTQA
jgi:hypothetical protein